MSEATATSAPGTTETVRLVHTSTGDVVDVPVVGPADSLFDTVVYRNVPTMDGQATDELAISFSGTIKYAASDPEGRALFDALTLGKSVTFQVEGVVAKKQGAWKIAGAGTENEKEVVTGSAGVKVESIYTPAPEALS